MKLAFEVSQVEVLAAPYGEGSRYVGYARAASLPEELSNWLRINPRTQNMNSGVAKAIRETLRERPHMMYLLSKGLVFAAQEAAVDGDTLALELEDDTRHGLGDGGHTYRAIQQVKQAGELAADCYVKFEVFTGLATAEIISIIAAQNQTVQVDTKSFEDLNHSFDVLKELLAGLPFADRVEYKMNQAIELEGKGIDVREVLGIITMFSREWFPFDPKSVPKNGMTEPVHYGKGEAVLKRFLDMDKETREDMLRRMGPIIPDIFALWDAVELGLPVANKQVTRAFQRLPLTKYNEGKPVDKTLFTWRDMQYKLPKSILYPMVAAFRALVGVNEDTGVYCWEVNPFEAWEAHKESFAKNFLESKVPHTRFGSKASYYNHLLTELHIHLIRKQLGEI